MIRTALTAVAALLLTAGCASRQLAPADWPADVAARVELTQVPFHSQRRHHCGPAALAGVLAAAGTVVDPDTLASEVYLPGRRGSLQTEIVAAARRRDLLAYELDPSFEALIRELAGGRPVLVLQNLGIAVWPRWHYAVVVGYDVARDRLLLHSGRRSRLETRRARFEVSWRLAGRWGIVVSQPDQVPRTADLLRFVRAAADLEAVGRPAAARRAYGAAVARWPEAPLPRIALAGALLAAGDPQGAERALQQAVAAGVTDAVVFNNLADLLGRRGCRNAALRVLQRAEAIAPSGEIASAVAVTRSELEALAAGVEPADCPTS